MKNTDFFETIVKYTRLSVHHNVIDKTNIYFINEIECSKEEYEVVKRCVNLLKQ